jgi:hypothetical protein
MAANIRDAIRDHLLATAQVTAITSVIRPGVLAQQDAAPCVLVKVVSNVPQEWVNSQERMYRARVAVQAYGENVTASDTLAQAIRDNALPPLTKGTIQGINVREISLEGGPFDNEDQPKDGSDEWMRHVRQDFLIHYVI